MVSEEGLNMDPYKVETILSWPIPRSVYEVSIFHGITSFYRKFIQNFSQICAPIIDTFRGSRQTFKWTKATNRNLNC